MSYVTAYSVQPRAHHFPSNEPITPSMTMAEYAAAENKRMNAVGKGEYGGAKKGARMRAAIFAVIKDQGTATSRDIADQTGFSAAYVARVLSEEYRAGRLTRERAHRVDPYLYEVAE